MILSIYYLPPADEPPTLEAMSEKADHLGRDFFAYRGIIYQIQSRGSANLHPAIQQVGHFELLN